MDIILAVKPKWLKLILSREKTAEFRRSLPKNLGYGDLVYLYYDRKIHGCAEVLDAVYIKQPSCSAHAAGCEYLAKAYAEEGKIDSQAAYDYLLGGSHPGVILLDDAETYTPPRQWKGAPVQNYVYYNYNY